MPRTHAELKAVLNLLDETEPHAVQRLLAQLAKWPLEDLRALSQAGAPGSIARRHIENVYARRRFQTLDEQWRSLCAHRVIDLEAALMLVARTGPTEFSEADVRAEIDDLGQRVGARLSGDRAFDTGLDALSAVLHGEVGLRGNEADYYDIENSFLPSVLKRRLGIPISLASIAIIVAQKLDLPVCGVGTPGHFLCFYGDMSIPSGTYFDPFGGFRRLSRASVEKLVQDAGARPEPWMFAPANEREIVARTLRNLIAIHRTTAQLEAADRLLGWLETLINHGQS